MGWGEVSAGQGGRAEVLGTGGGGGREREQRAATLTGDGGGERGPLQKRYNYC